MNTIKKIIGWICLSPIILAACICCLFTAPMGLLLAFPVAAMSELAKLRNGGTPNIGMAKEFAMDFAFFPVKLVLE